ncbi:MAG TPA: FAD-dependent oxidoreductase [Gemmatimonadaceae bacterium]|nr:FAD-dependent oxidoreductase [Gemmatimonadaceae bacterium]
MASDSAPLEGPDFTAGVPLDDLPEGGMLLGHGHGEPILLARVDGNVHAVGARCTHYGGPLAEGVIANGMVRCPWHHACFDVRTGVAVRPPALLDLPRWRVEVRDGKAFVRDRLADDRQADATRAQKGGASRGQAPESVLIVGAGAAGNAAAETLRREGYAGPVTLIDPDPGAPCDRPNLSKDYLAGTAPEEWIPLHPSEFYEEQEIEIVHGARVGRIDARARRVELEDGSSRSYGALILATGARPVRLRDVGVGTERIHTLRTLADSRAIIARATESRRAVVIGASFIGLEVAASLRARDIEVHVVAPEARPLERVMGPELGHAIRTLHEQRGVIFHMGRTVRAVGLSDVTLDDGTWLEADLVVAGIGVRPAVELAEGAGLTVDNGVMVDEHLRTNAPGIVAAGDIARWPDRLTGEHIRVEHWVVAERQGQAAARTTLGLGEPFDAVPFFWSQHYDVVIAYVGHATHWDETKVDGDPLANDCAVRFVRGGKTLAVATIFRDRESLEAEIAMEQAIAAARARGVSAGATATRGGGTRA